MIALLALSLTGCTPVDAEVTGQWFVWLPANTSATTSEEALEGIEDTATVFECSGRGWDADLNDWDEAYVGPREDDDPSDARWIGGDCNPDDSDCLPYLEEMQAECDRIDAFEYFIELQNDGYYALTAPLDVWRAEAAANNDGTFQLTMHHDLGSGQDFRFHFTIDPDFAPVLCTDDENGDPLIEYVDGQKWTDAWSADEDGYTMYFLNALGYQAPPEGLTEGDSDYWYMPVDWSSGYGLAKFASDEFGINAAPIYPAVDHTRINDAEYDLQADYDASIVEYTEIAQKWTDELVDVGGAHIDGDPQFAWKVEDNTWREVDRDSAGLDGYIELHASYVRIKDGADFEPGGSLEGDFQLLYYGGESQAYLLVNGSFIVDNIRADKWGYPDFEEEKRDENGEPFCNGAPMP